MRRTYYEGHGSLLHETWTWHPIAVCIKHSWNIWFWCGRDVEMLSWAEQCHLPVLTIRLWFLDFFSLFLPCVTMPPSSSNFMHASYIHILLGIKREQQNFSYWQAFRFSVPPFFWTWLQPFVSQSLMPLSVGLPAPLPSIWHPEASFLLHTVISLSCNCSLTFPLGNKWI